MKCTVCSREIDPERECVEFETGLCESCFEEVLRPIITTTMTMNGDVNSGNLMMMKTNKVGRLVRGRARRAQAVRAND